jgi:hypothetical protein
VIPDSLLGLLLFVGSIGPGYVWMLFAERRRPREERSAILEAAELAFVGVSCTGTATLVVLAVIDAWDSLEVDTGRLANDGVSYIAEEPIRGLGTLLVILGLSYGLALLAARLKYGSDEPVVPGHNAWDEMFALSEYEQQVYATAELRDGRCFSGLVYRWDAGSAAERRDLTLRAPISVRLQRGAETVLKDTHFLALHQDEIVWLSAAWVPLRNTEAPTPAAAIGSGES